MTQVITATTRPRRPAERDGVDYQFVAPERFQQMIEQGELLEHARVYGNLYGVPRAQVRALLEQGEDVLIKVDIQGATTIKKLVPQAVFIFVLPPSPEALFERLKQRRTESPAEMERRLKAADDEIRKLPLFDYAVVNRWDEIDAAVADIQAIITAEKRRVTPREIVV